MTQRWFAPPALRCNTLAAWQAIGAADMWDAIVNRTLDGTHPLVPVSGFGWTKAAGFTWSNPGAYMETGFITKGQTDTLPKIGERSLIVRAHLSSPPDAGDTYVIGDETFGIQFQWFFSLGNFCVANFYNYGTLIYNIDARVDHVYAISGKRCFVDGAYVGNAGDTSWVAADHAMLVATHDSGSLVVGGLAYYGCLLEDSLSAIISEDLALLDENSAPPTTPWRRKVYVPIVSSPRDVCCDPPEPQLAQEDEMPGPEETFEDP